MHPSLNIIKAGMDVAALSTLFGWIVSILPTTTLFLTAIWAAFRALNEFNKWRSHRTPKT